MGTITAFVEPMSKVRLSDAAPDYQDSCLSICASDNLSLPHAVVITYRAAAHLHVCCGIRPIMVCIRSCAFQGNIEAEQRKREKEERKRRQEEERKQAEEEEAQRKAEEEAAAAKVGILTKSRCACTPAVALNANRSIGHDHVMGFRVVVVTVPMPCKKRCFRPDQGQVDQLALYGPACIVWLHQVHAKSNVYALQSSSHSPECSTACLEEILLSTFRIKGSVSGKQCYIVRHGRQMTPGVYTVFAQSCWPIDVASCTLAIEMCCVFLVMMVVTVVLQSKVRRCHASKTPAMLQAGKECNAAGCMFDFWQQSVGAAGLSHLTTMMCEDQDIVQAEEERKAAEEAAKQEQNEDPAVAQMRRVLNKTKSGIKVADAFKQIEAEGGLAGKWRVLYEVSHHCYSSMSVRA